MTARGAHFVWEVSASRRHAHGRAGPRGRPALCAQLTGLKLVYKQSINFLKIKVSSLKIAFNKILLGCSLSPFSKRESFIRQTWGSVQVWERWRHLTPPPAVPTSGHQDRDSEAPGEVHCSCLILAKVGLTSSFVLDSQGSSRIRSVWCF